MSLGIGSLCPCHLSAMVSDWSTGGLPLELSLVAGALFQYYITCTSTHAHNNVLQIPPFCFATGNYQKSDSSV